jgi:hypothetical protein
VGRFGEGDEVEKENKQRVMGIMCTGFFFDGFLPSGLLRMCGVMRLGSRQTTITSSHL